MLFGTQNTFWVAGYGVFISSNRIMFECLFVEAVFRLFPREGLWKLGKVFCQVLVLTLLVKGESKCIFLTARQLHFWRIRLVKPPRNTRSLVGLRNVQHFYK